MGVTPLEPWLQPPVGLRVAPELPAPSGAAWGRLCLRVETPHPGLSRVSFPETVPRGSGQCRRLEKGLTLAKCCWGNVGFPGGSAGKESVCNAGALGSIPGWGRPPGEGNGYRLQYSYPEGNTEGGAGEAGGPLGWRLCTLGLLASRLSRQLCGVGDPAQPPLRSPGQLLLGEPQEGPVACQQD